MEDLDIHKHCFDEIFCIEKDISKQSIDYKEYEVAPSSLFFISPNQVHQFKERKPIKDSTILFTEQGQQLFFRDNKYLIAKKGIPTGQKLYFN